MASGERANEVMKEAERKYPNKKITLAKVHFQGVAGKEVPTIIMRVKVKIGEVEGCLFSQ